MMAEEGVEDIDLTYWPNWIRLLSAVILAGCAGQIGLLLLHYWHRIMPLREEINAEELIAPPPRWTFAYHVCVLALVLLAIGTRLELAMEDHEPTLGLIGFPVVGIVLTIVVTQFSRYYSRTLNRTYDRKHGLPPRT